MPAILVIDDDAAVGQAVERILATAGYAVTVTTSGRAGVAAAAAKSFSAAIVDLCMPQMDGLDTIRVLRSLAPKLPVIVMSGLMSDQTANAPDFLGMSANLAGVRRLGKPFRNHDLLAIVAQCCATTDDKSASCAA